jgi:WD40 repeat protein
MKTSKAVLMLVLLSLFFSASLFNAPALVQASQAREIVALSWNNNNYLAVGYTGGVVEVVNAATRQLIASKTLPDYIRTVDWQMNTAANRLVVSTWEYVFVWDMDTDQVWQHRFETYHGEARWNADGTQIAVFSSSGSGALDRRYITVAEPTSGLVLHKLGLLDRRDNGVTDFDWHPTQTHLLASVHGNDTFRIWDVQTGEILHTAQVEGARYVAWNMEGLLLGVVGGGETYAHISLFNGDTYELSQNFSIAVDAKIVWSRYSYGQFAIISSRLRIYDLISENLIFSIDPSNDFIEDATWSPSGNQIAYGGSAPLEIVSILPPPPTDLRALYAAYNSAPVTPVLHPSVVIRNDGNTPVPLSEVRLRYYFTRDGSADLQASCTFIPYYPSGVLPDIIPEPQPCASSVIVETGALTVPTATADSYLELRFTDGTLPANGYTVQYILSVNKADWSAFQQTNDYSFSIFGTYPLPVWDKITLTRQGAMVWGAAPR